jgi:hypothetical protein
MWLEYFRPEIGNTTVISVRYQLLLCCVFGQGLFMVIKGKVKCILVQALRLCTGRTACRGSRGIAHPFYDRGTSREVRG